MHSLELARLRIRKQIDRTFPCDRKSHDSGLLRKATSAADQLLAGGYDGLAGGCNPMPGAFGAASTAQSAVNGAGEWVLGDDPDAHLLQQERKKLVGFARLSPSLSAFVTGLALSLAVHPPFCPSRAPHAHSGFGNADAGASGKKSPH